MDRRHFTALLSGLPLLRVLSPRLALAQTPRRRTEVSIRGDGFLINGRPTYEGRQFEGHKVEGLLMNIRAVQATFDDLNPETSHLWAYPDTGKWDPDRNTSEFIAAMDEWKRSGILAFTVNLQGGTPGNPAGAAALAGGNAAAGGRGGDAAAGRDGTPAAGRRGAGGRGRGGFGRVPLENSAFDPEGSLRPAYMQRLERIIDRADELGMVVIVGYFYVGQNQRLKDETAVKAGVRNATNWLLDKGYRNVLVEVDNECNLNFVHDILRPPRLTELFDLVKSLRRGNYRLLVSSSFGGPTSGPRDDNPNTPATSGMVGAGDFVEVHGNGPADPDMFNRMVAGTRGLPTFRGTPVVVNEDPNFNFEDPNAHINLAIRQYVSWGYYDQGKNNYHDGFQSVPVNWQPVSPEKRGFLDKVKQITGGA